MMTCLVQGDNFKIHYSLSHIQTTFPKPLTWLKSRDQHYFPDLISSWNDKRDLQHPAGLVIL